MCKILLSSNNGANAIVVYDNSSAASGTVVAYIPASAQASSIYDVQMPCSSGITIAATASAATITISFS